MADDKIINRFINSTDGRRVEQRIVETSRDDGFKERVTETHVEQIPLALEERVVEKIVPIVTERRKETYQDGKVIKTEVEQVDDQSLHLTIPTGTAQITKEDITKAIREAMADIKVPAIKREVKAPKVEQPVVVHAPVVAPVTDSATPDWHNYAEWGLYITLAAELGFIVYQFFLKG